MYDEAMSNAIERIRKGWTKRVIRDGNKVCAIGGIIYGNNLTSFEYVDTQEAIEIIKKAYPGLQVAIFDTVCELYPNMAHKGSITSLNDNSETPDAVIQVFEKVRAKENV